MQIPVLEKIVITALNKTGISLSAPIRFSQNQIRKTSIHRTNCFTVFSAEEIPEYVIKFPAQTSDIANNSLRRDYQTLQSLFTHEALNPFLPTPVTLFEINSMNFSISTYCPNTPLSTYFESAEDLPRNDTFYPPLNWLLAFYHTTSSGNRLTAERFDTIYQSLTDTIHPNFTELKQLLQVCRATFDTQFQALIQETTPLAMLHGDFNSYNIGLNDHYDPIIFDWEDSRIDWPVMVDFFHYVIIAFMQIINKIEISEPWTRATLSDAYDIVLSQVQNQMNRFQTAFHLSDLQMDGLMVLTLLTNVATEAAEKRMNPPQYIYRWIHILQNITDTPFILSFMDHFFQTYYEQAR